MTEQQLLFRFAEVWQQREKEIQMKLERIKTAREVLDELTKDLEEQFATAKLILREISTGRLALGVGARETGVRIRSRPEAQVTGKYGSMTIRDATYALLSEARAALHVRDIYTSLTEGGVVFRAKRPPSSIAAILSRDNRFENIGGNRFRIRGGIQEPLIISNMED